MINLDDEINALYSKIYTLEKVKNSVESLFNERSRIISFDSQSYDFIVGLSANIILKGQWKSNHYHIVFELNAKDDSIIIYSGDLMIEQARENSDIIDIMIRKSNEIEDSLLKNSKVQKSRALLIAIIQNTLSEFGITDFEITTCEGKNKDVIVKKKLIANCTLNAFMNLDNYSSQIVSLVNTLASMPKDLPTKLWDEIDMIPKYFCKRPYFTDGIGLLSEKGLKMNYHGLQPDMSLINQNHNYSDGLLKKLSDLGFYFKEDHGVLTIILNNDLSIIREGNKTRFNKYRDYIIISKPDMLKFVSMIAMASQVDQTCNPYTKYPEKDFAYGFEPIFKELLPP